MSLVLPPLSLYVHMPWCVRKCPYCDFNSHAAPELVPQAQYIDALLEDLQNDLAAAQGRALTSIFFGGGTPSLFAPDQIGRLLEGVRRQIRFDPGIEITLEANPGTIEHGRFSGYRDAGVNRVSLGAQTFNEEQLKLLGRIHGAGDIARAVEELGQAGIDNFNLDLMYGLPAQNVSQALQDLASALALQPTHLSQYQLTLEPGTVFYHRPPPLPDPDDCWQMQIDSQELLATRGYEQYEVSAYARTGRRSRHNLNYWEFGDYIGIGAGAHGKLTRPDAGGAIVRTARVKQPREYLSRAADSRVSEQRVVPAGDLPFEFMLNGLRLIDGFDEETFESRTGLSFAVLEQSVSQAERKGLLERDGDRHWRATAEGQRFLNDLQELFLPT
ncbi:YggW family oxidoreductase [Steroidobacter agaridevorans]|uniref:Heme chaperone HemW n=1 Tax=Steroidobacter agaridevorans TaxID=2695856 RepID=A0A829Y516_9GAMM|nr:radical SAM family heme chaperone HemW [Steroidobacter agaridevorans]GFE78284.1 YggW family oxidoreductase [Steroidobacter agaridevorans]GFE89783.1 YggW family oxidoreductase [Steroidobacter agaridevorans]